MRGIAVFDLDGTLARTSEVDDACWLEAASDVLGLGSMETDWSHYPHSTDEAIALELIRTRSDLAPTEENIHRVRDAFAERIDAASRRRPEWFHPVPGAPVIFEAMRSSGWAVAIATGGWRRTARLKLEAAGIPHADVPAAHADDAHPREKIIEIAMARARESSGETFDRGVYVGDGRWDVLATDRMGLGFVGIAEGDRADLLRSVGATTVLPDYRDFSAFLEAVERLATPLAT